MSVRRTTKRGVTVAQAVVVVNDVTPLAQVNADTTERPLQPRTSFLSLPREIRDLIYEIHLESAINVSRPLDPRFQSTSGLDSYLSVRENWRPIKPPHIFQGYYQPVYHEEPYTRWYGFSYTEPRARENNLPALIQLDHPLIAREARDLCLGRRMLVDVDTLNWFQTWCLDLPTTELAQVRKLHIASQVSYTCPPGTKWEIFRRRDLLKQRMYHQFPIFMLSISDDGLEFTVTSRYKLVTEELAVLRKNLQTMLSPTLQAHSKRFDGADILEAMFAFHNKRIQAERSVMVIGPLRKHSISWAFQLEEQDLDSQDLEPPNPTDKEAAVAARLRRGHGSVNKHLILRAVVEHGVVST